MTNAVSIVTDVVETITTTVDGVLPLIGTIIGLAAIVWLVFLAWKWSKRALK